MKKLLACDIYITMYRDRLLVVLKFFSTVYSNTLYKRFPCTHFLYFIIGKL